MVTVQSMSPLLFKLPFFSISVFKNDTCSFLESSISPAFAYAVLYITLEVLFDLAFSRSAAVILVT